MKQYPEKPLLSQKPLEPMSDADMERAARRNTIRLGGEIKK